MAEKPPSGTVTFLLTDLEGSTRLWERDPEAMKAAMVRHDELLEMAVASHRGYIFSRMGDGMATAFASAGDAVCAALTFAQSLAEQVWQTPGPLRARIGLHTAEAVIVDDSGYANLPINRCARLMAAAHGGQIVMSGATEMLLRDAVPTGVEVRSLGRHRLRDLGQPMQIYELAKSDHRNDFPPLRSLDSFPGNLPPQVTSFIGRKTEVAAVIAALAGSAVVTITGPGGVGKTRLALQAAAEILPRYRDGAWLIELAPLRDPDGLVPVVAAAFRVSSGGPALEDSLLEMLADKELLVVLDNCEHLLSSVARVVSRIERQCPGVAVLATSREGIAVSGEQLIALPPLASGESADSVSALVRTDAVRLFVERARNINADFALTQSNAAAVAEICQRLDGVPLAIELAAARVIALTPHELLQRLDRRFQLLADGRRGAVERHTTLRAAMDWSYDLLNEAEQCLLSRLAVFSGGCTLEAIEAVCGGDPVDREAIVDLVSGLVARSLVVAEDRGVGTRYRMLETIRQYGEERLAERGEFEKLLASHGRFYAELLTVAAERSYGTEQLSWAGRLNLDRDNVRLALNTAIETDNGALAVQLVANHPNRHGQGAMPVGTVLMDPVYRVLELDGALESPGYPRVLMVAAYQAFYSDSNYALAMDLCEKALATDRDRVTASGGPRIEMDAWSLRAMVSLSAGDYAAAVAGYTRAADVARADGYPGVAATYLAYGVNARLLGGIGAQQALAEAQESVALARRSGMPGSIVQSLNALALALAERDPVRARAALRESIERGDWHTDDVSGSFVTACMVAGRLRDWSLTLNLAARAMHVWRWDMSPLWAAICLAECARALAQDEPEVAGILRGAAYATFQRASPEGGSSRMHADNNFVLAALRETGELVAAARVMTAAANYALPVR
ncbi:adenylate/guanylate cyclase domain-containing protein [Mycobacterium sp. E740]|uniref:ATP-binding protein n=1 Tax=Mycobacterium sp. E740 TaxID=1834149 RepID=UPI0007FB7833|nr:adenylate/guanylate cyclase domain-containing protein [Mycobacterium sp. E740]OBI72977.1 hypothetical protein A5663_07495 [Mycobacterium sp. E740]